MGVFGTKPGFLGWPSSSAPPGFDDDFLQWRAQPSITAPSQKTQLVYNDWYVAAKEHGNYEKYDRVWWRASEIEDNAMVSLVNPGSSLTTKIGSPLPTWNSFRGFTGSASGGALNWQYVPSTDAVNFTRNSCCIWIFCNSFFDSVKAMIGNTNCQIIPSDSGNLKGMVNGQLVSVANANSYGVLSINRPNATTSEIWWNGVLVFSGSSNSSALTNESIYELATNISGVLTNPFPGEVLAAGTANGSLDQLTHAEDLINFFGSLPVWSFYGDSITQGSLASPNSSGWAYLLPAAKGMGYYNAAVGGSTASSFLASGVPIHIKTANYNQKLFLAWGVNDSLSTTTAVYKTKYQSIIDLAIDAGWTVNEIIIISGYYVDSSFYTGYAPFITAAQEVAQANGIREFNLYPLQYALSDLVHPNTAGHAAINAYLSSQL